jgi:hypothetical protein
MGVVIEICVKYPRGPTRNKGTDIELYQQKAKSGSPLAFVTALA